MIKTYTLEEWYKLNIKKAKSKKDAESLKLYTKLLKRLLKR